MLFEDEESYSVVEFDRIQEKSVRYNQAVNVVWEKGQSARTCPAKLLFSGMFELLLSFRTAQFESTT